MARIRTIKPEFWTDEDIASLSEPARLLAIGLLNHSDDEGYFKANHLLLKAAVFPLCEPSLSIHELISELSLINYIELTTGSDNKQYGRVRGFTKHQKVNRPNKSKIKDLCNFNECEFNKESKITDYSLSDHGCVTDDSLTEQGTGNREQVLEQGNDSGYAFCGEVIKLNLKDLKKWEDLFPNIDLVDELQRLDLEFKHENPKNWFVTASNKLNYQNKNAKQKPQSDQPDWMRGVIG